MGRIAHLKKVPINKTLIVQLLKRKNKITISFLRIELFFNYKNLSPHALCPVWLKSAQWFKRKRFLNLSMYFYYFIVSPWRRVWPFNWKKNECSPHKNALCQVSLKWEQWSYRKKMKMWKVKRQIEWQKDDEQEAIRKTHLSFQLR